MTSEQIENLRAAGRAARDVEEVEVIRQRERELQLHVPFWKRDASYWITPNENVPTPDPRYAKWAIAAMRSAADPPRYDK